MHQCFLSRSACACKQDRIPCDGGPLQARRSLSLRRSSTPQIQILSSSSARQSSTLFLPRAQDLLSLHLAILSNVNALSVPALCVPKTRRPASSPSGFRELIAYRGYRLFPSVSGHSIKCKCSFDVDPGVASTEPIVMNTVLKTHLIVSDACISAFRHCILIFSLVDDAQVTTRSDEILHGSVGSESTFRRMR